MNWIAVIFSAPVDWPITLWPYSVCVPTTNQLLLSMESESEWWIEGGGGVGVSKLKERRTNWLNLTVLHLNRVSLVPLRGGLEVVLMVRQRVVVGKLLNWIIRVNNSALISLLVCKWKSTSHSSWQKEGISREFSAKFTSCGVSPVSQWNWKGGALKKSRRRK